MALQSASYLTLHHRYDAIMSTKRQKIWLWTWKLTGSTAVDTIASALKLGYRTIDTARIYDNAAEIATAIQISWIPRSELFITSKTRFDYIPNYQKHQFQKSDFSYSLRKQRFEKHLQDLKTNYLDELLIHRPTREENDLALLELLSSYQQKGIIKHIWVSNFPISYLKKLRPQLPCQLSCNQIELHPCLFDPEIINFSKANNLQIVAYSPLAHWHLLKNPTINQIAKKHQTTPAQICIARCLAQGVNVLVKASTPEKLVQNLNSEKIILDRQDFDLISSLPKNHRYNNPPFSPTWN